MGDITVGEYTVSKENEVTVTFKEDVEIDPNLEGSIDIDVTSITQQERKQSKIRVKKVFQKMTQSHLRKIKLLTIKKPLKRNKTMKMNY